MIPIKKQLDMQKTIDDLIKRVNILSKVSGRNGIKVVEGSSGIQLVGDPNNLKIKVFRVVSEATGDSVYNCFEQRLRDNTWENTFGDKKFQDKSPAVEAEVLNIAEFDPESIYTAHLKVLDYLVSWQKLDDDGNLRWVGLPFRAGAHGDLNRIVYCRNSAGGGTTIQCYLDSNFSATTITVNCFISGGSALNAAIPRLVAGDQIIVTKIGATWYCTTVFGVELT